MPANRRRPAPRTSQEARERLSSCYDEMRLIGFILRGTVNRRLMRCGNPGCKCRGNPPALHGPYYDWTRKVEGKTVSVRLTQEEAKTVREWIGHARRLDEVLVHMEALSAAAVRLIRR